jgi:acyl-CoA dehydrogenase
MYRAPLKDLRFVLHELIGESSLQACPAHGEYSLEIADAILEEAAKFAETVLDPLYKSGDRDGARWTPEGVIGAPGFKAAYQQYAEGGWPSLRASPHFGGQGVPNVVGTAVEEIWAASNLAFKLCPMLTQGAIEALEHYGSDAQKAQYLPKMVSGEWTGTMNLTEPQAGSDLAAIRTRATPEGDRYRIFGQKIFITYGDHDFTPNTIHLVLARIDGAPPGVKGISMFIVPKVLVNADGSLGERNDAHCISIEHKLGIHASPTCVMAFGQKDGAIGYLVGEPNRGLEYMFVMMNAARLSVGLEGYAVADRAYQQALDWARTRVQGKPPVAAAQGPLPIAHHPDVKRMLLTMKSQTEALRAVALYTAWQLDLGAHHPDPAVRAAAQARGDLLIPIVKGCSTEAGIDLASLGIQIHGGMGFVEETGAAQPYRDVRITTIYEGTTGIHGLTLLGRGIPANNGAALQTLGKLVYADISVAKGHESIAKYAGMLEKELENLTKVTMHKLGFAMKGEIEVFLADSTLYMELFGLITVAWQWLKQGHVAAAALAKGGLSAEDEAFYKDKIHTMKFFYHYEVPKALGLSTRLMDEEVLTIFDHK